MKIIESLIIIAWSIRIIRNTLAYIHLWFVKEYRPDRMWIHLAKTVQGKWIYFPKFKYPPKSPKTIALFISLTSIELVLFFVLPFTYPLVKLFVIDVILFPLSFLLVILMRIPTVLFHQYKIQKAKRLLEKHSWKTVIGITGSYGKTSTKEFVSTILSDSYTVLKTELSKNSAIGISETVLKMLDNSYDAFVVEMGAYKMGEITQMASLTHPTIGIITAINAQHQDLFGSIETTMKAKYELLSHLTGKRIAIVNADNQFSYEMGQWAKKDGCDVWYVTTDKQKYKEATVWLSDMTSNEDTCSCTIHYQSTKKHLNVHIRGEHFMFNIALAIAAAIASGMSFEKAVLKAETIESVDRVMERSRGKNNEILINDTFNNNPDAAIAALMYLKKFTKKKFLVFQPMIELGTYTNESHKKVGKVAGEFCDEIILTNTNFSQPFINGVYEADPKKHVHILSAQQASSFIEKHVHKDDAVLFKGKEAEFVWKLLH